MTKLRLTGAITGMAAIAAVTFASPAFAQLKIGVAGPITGSSASFGAQLKQGTEMAAADLNAKGGVNGQKIEVVAGDDVADPKQGVSVANKFVGDGVKWVVGHFNSGVTMPASEVYQENGILMLTPSATNPKITERGMWNVFRTCGRDDQQGAVAGDFIAKNYKGKKVAVVHDKTTYGKGLADETKKAMNAAGVTEVLYEGVNTGEKDFSALVGKIKSSGADILYWGGLHTEGGLIVRQMRDQGMTAVMMSGDGITSDEFASIGGPGVEGTLMTFPPDPRNRPEAAAKPLQVANNLTSREMARLFRLNVLDPNGTGKRADVQGYRVGGKTGTADRAEGGRYEEKTVISSFLGAFPMDAPQYLTFVLLFEPKGTVETGGQRTASLNAAPVTGRIIRRIAPQLSVAPLLAEVTQ